MRLYLVRHALAVPRGTPGYARDAQRPLTDEGREQARSVGDGLKRLKVGAGTLVLTSPYARAAQTAEAIVKACDVRAPLAELPDLRPETPPQETSRALAAFASYDQLVLVGHEPHMSAWLGELIAGPHGLRCLFKKAGVACVEVERVPPPSGSGILRWFLTPKQLALLAKS